MSKQRKFGQAIELLRIFSALMFLCAASADSSLRNEPTRYLDFLGFREVIFEDDVVYQPGSEGLSGFKRKDCSTVDIVCLEADFQFAVPRTDCENKSSWTHLGYKYEVITVSQSGDRLVKQIWKYDSQPDTILYFRFNCLDGIDAILFREAFEDETTVRPYFWHSGRKLFAQR